jgi:glucose-induced degradation protein 8
MALLIFTPDNPSPALAQLLEPDLRQEVANDVNEAILARTSQRREARLRNLVRLRSYSEQAARAAGKDIPSHLPLGLDPENDDDDDGMNGSTDADAMVS